MHMHGLHFEAIASDGRPLPAPILKHTISVAAGERYDLLVTVDEFGSTIRFTATTPSTS